jgi:hypothetical protein
MHRYIQGGPKVGIEYILYGIVLLYTYFGPPCIKVEDIKITN